MVILPLQDVLGLDDSARMNTPGTTGTNWQWQARAEQIPEALQKLRSLEEKINKR